MAFLGAEHPHDCYTDPWSAILLPTVTVAVAWPLVFSWVICYHHCSADIFSKQTPRAHSFYLHLGIRHINP